MPDKSSQRKRRWLRFLIIIILVIGCYHLACRKSHYDYVTHLIELSGSGDLSYDFVRSEADRYHFSKLKPLITEKEGKDKEERSVSEAIEFYRMLGTAESAERIAVLEPYTVYEGEYFEKGGESKEIRVGVRNGTPYYSVFPYGSTAPLGEVLHSTTDYGSWHGKSEYFLDTDALTLTYECNVDNDDSTMHITGRYVSKKSVNYRELLNGTWERTVETKKSTLDKAGKNTSKQSKNEKVSQPYKGSSGSSSSGNPYDVDHYSDAEDFADEWEDEFDSWDDAWDYWQDHH